MQVNFTNPNELNIEESRQRGSKYWQQAIRTCTGSHGVRQKLYPQDTGRAIPQAPSSVL